MKSRRASRLIYIGLLLVAAALFLMGYNVWDEWRAGQTVNQTAGLLAERVPPAPASAPANVPASEIEIPDYILNPEKDMPTEEIDGQKYIGVLRIPTQGLELPVISEWSYPRLKLAPCRFYGSVYLDNMVIAAHNYPSHFGTLKDLALGDTVTVTDMDGVVWQYEVETVEILSPTDVDAMTDGEYDLTLFTCTYGGQSRVTVRCRRIDTGSKQAVLG